MSMIQTIEVIQRKVELNVELTVVIRPVAYYTKEHKCGFVHLFFFGGGGGNVNVDPTGKIFKVHVTRSVCWETRDEIKLSALEQETEFIIAGHDACMICMFIRYKM